MSTTVFESFVTEETPCLVIKCIWTIKNFALYKGERITSSTYPAMMHGEHHWYVALEDIKTFPPTGFGSPRFSIHFPFLKHNLDGKIIANFMVSKGIQLGNSIHMKVTLKKKQTEQICECHNILRLPQLRELMKVLQTGNSDLRIETQLFIPRCTLPTVNIYRKLPTIQSLYTDFARLFHTKTSTDITFIVDDKEFSAHKVILIARSPVFRGMFNHPMKEQQEDRVDITDIKPDVFVEVLRFMYTDEVENIDVMAIELLEAAEKYQLEGLKEHCERKLQKCINIENAAETYIYAERYNAELLKNSILDFIVINRKKVIETWGFESMKKLHPESTMNLFQKIISRIP